jgi:Mor family transcriptional regulator
MSNLYAQRRNRERNAQINALKRAGVNVDELARVFELSVKQIYRVTNRKNNPGEL